MIKIKNKILITIIIILIVVFFYLFFIQNNTKENIEYQQTNQNNNVISKEELCVQENFTTPSEQELNFNNEIKKDEFVSHLRKSFDKFLNGNISEEDDFSFENNSEYTEYIKSKFIVLSTDIAPGGGESIIILFKDKPDKVFYTWVYNDSENNYNLKSFNEYDIEKSSKSTIEEIQQTFINQICSKNFGI